MSEFRAGASAEQCSPQTVLHGLCYHWKLPVLTSQGRDSTMRNKPSASAVESGHKSTAYLTEPCLYFHRTWLS